MGKKDIRKQIVEKVFAYDNNKCVVCKEKAVDAHHLLNRKLWDDGGYHLHNLVSLCSEHHLDAETNQILPDDLRKLGTRDLKLPPGFSHKEQYDTWGNTILPNGLYSYGPLKNDKGMQKALKELPFTNKVKYPSTSYLPNSPTIDENDTIIDPACFQDKLVVVTEKMDGENTTMARDYIHARSLDSAHHPSRSWVKQKWAEIRYEIPEGWRICGENIYALHSIKYEELESYFFGFSIWNDKNICLSWDNTLEWFSLLDIIPAPVLYEGEYDLNKIHIQWESLNKTKESEGYVMRKAKAFSYRDFPYSLAKWVRPNHVQKTDGKDVHWMHKFNIEPNSLKS